ncbi:hypothetical protein CMQ_829 [Grosmannia clavigera kw1407]|uniref:Haloacid dehalogenase-like hydrolase n=1 Tax=Grosmannia clavigera (strain kw1407 / UAMH 11150) TaxID=655863 RepID=F0XE04_GROCL|nr:uncharacterized protein CMQ_829 [Grosmannia clavigera kw1407]EFX03901.1 hypothetical protein CMQ_829 [Grosmannia clavigera kw1407]
MHIILDFDGTITQNDTINALSSAAVAFRQQQQQQQQKVEAQEEDWTNHWTSIVDAYVADYLAHVSGYEPLESERTDLVSELGFLDAMREAVDLPSIQRVHDSRLFAGITADQLTQAGRDASTADTGTVRLRAGFSSFLDDISGRRGWPVSIVSINWSDAWIRGVIESSPHSQGVSIFSNKVTVSGRIVPNFNLRVPTDQEPSEPSEPLEPLVSCSDKHETMKVAAELAEEQVVYIGDAMTDIMCLTNAEAGGIVMASGGPGGSSTLKALARLKKEIPHVSDSPKFSTVRTPGSLRLAWAADFDEILSSGILD